MALPSGIVKPPPVTMRAGIGRVIIIIRTKRVNHSGLRAHLNTLSVASSEPGHGTDEGGEADMALSAHWGIHAKLTKLDLRAILRPCR